MLHLGDTFFVGDRVAKLEKVQKVSNPYVLSTLGPSDVAVEATIRIYGPDGAEFIGRPVFMIRNQEVGLLPDVVEDAGARLALSEINPTAQTFTILTETSKTDWVIMKAMEKPGINILWIGILVMSFGFALSIKRRFDEAGDQPAKHQKSGQTSAA